MRVLTESKYDYLVNTALRVLKADNEVKRKQFVVDRKQKVINKIKKQLNKIEPDATKEELQCSILKMQDIVINE